MENLLVHLGDAGLCFWKTGANPSWGRQQPPSGSAADAAGGQTLPDASSYSLDAVPHPCVPVFLTAALLFLPHCSSVWEAGATCVSPGYTSKPGFLRPWLCNKQGGEDAPA